MSDLFERPDDAATPLTPEETRDLIPAHIAYRRELNEAEQENIARAQEWALSRRRDLVSEKFVKDLHRRMFGDVWRWAGQYRKSERNIGVDPYRIAADVQQTVDDARFWVEHATYPPDEIAVRFSHRLVFIHPFPNGNGRLSRLAGDLLARRLGQSPFTWGRVSLVDGGAMRARYVEALRAADGHDIAPLVLFARS